MTITVSAGQFAQTFKAHEKQRYQHFDETLRVAAIAGAPILRDAQPFDLGGLKRNTTVEEHHQGGVGGVVARIIEDTPYAAAMEYGTRPFKPPLRPLVEWAARKVLNANTNTFTGGGIPKAAWAIGKAIQNNIAANGLRARFFTRNSLPALRVQLGVLLRIAVTKKFT